MLDAVALLPQVNPHRQIAGSDFNLAVALQMPATGSGSEIQILLRQMERMAGQYPVNWKLWEAGEEFGWLSNCCFSLL